jgi:hypothetical protein
MPKAIRVAVLYNPAGDAPGSTPSELQDLQEAARTVGLQIRILNATTIGEIDAAFATFARERPDALSGLGQPRPSDETSGMSALHPIAAQADICTSLQQRAHQRWASRNSANESRKRRTVGLL